ncbi:MAG: outer membrane protein assembly factor BamD [Bacteroidia bacterium]|nr:outer membrane protein assembly factor BamD [Bacteroidia bacterium]
MLNKVKQGKKTVLLLGLFILFSACHRQNLEKILKGTNKKVKFEIAMEFYNQKKYDNAIAILEDLLGITKGDTMQRSVAYYYSYAHYKTNRSENFPLAAYYFRDFAQSFPSDPRAEECAYMSAYCYYLSSPRYTLDQEGTHKAIEQIQYFVENYPQSPRVKDANELIFKLREKLAYKKLMQAHLYFRTEYYKSAKITYEEMINSFPDSKYVEEARAGMVRSMYFYAKESTFEKQQERYLSMISLYQSFVDKHKNSTYLKELERYYESALNALERIKKAQASLEIIQKVSTAEQGLKKAERNMNQMRDSIKMLRSGQELRKELERARYQQDLAKQRLKAAKKALKKNVTPANQTELKEAEKALKIAQQNVQKAKQNKKDPKLKKEQKALANKLAKEELPLLEKKVDEAQRNLKDAIQKARIAKRDLRKKMKSKSKKEY